MTTGSAVFPQATGLFDTTVVVDELPNAAELNEALLEIINKRRKQSRGVTLSNVGGWQSDRQMLQWGGEPAARLLGRIIQAADRFTVDVASTGAARFRWVGEMWANVSPQHSSNQYHTHPGAFWSAVYYVDDGYGGATGPDLGGELILQDPRMPMIMMNMPNLRFRKPGRPADEPELAMRPAAGRLVMFPAWLNHCVMQYRGTRERVSIAVNVSAVPLRVPA